MHHLELADVNLESRRGAAGTDLVAVKDFRLTVDRGEFVALVGPSGCGKSSLLAAINGLVKPTSGEIRVDGRRVESPGSDRALVFQEFALLPWRTALGNVELGLELQGVPR